MKTSRLEKKIVRALSNHVTSAGVLKLINQTKAAIELTDAAIRPHTSLGYKSPAPEVFVPAFAAWPAALHRPAPPAQPPTLN
jgi:hypothetical protein